MAMERSRGYGLLEIALGIAIAALLVAGAMMYFQNATQERRANETLQFVAALHSAVYTIYSGQPDYTTVSTETVLRSHVLPNKYKGIDNNGNPILRHPLGSYAQILPGYGSQGRWFLIKLFGVPKTICTHIVTKIHSNSIDQWRIGSTNYTGIRMTPNLASQACQQEGGVSRTVEMEFRVR